MTQRLVLVAPSGRQEQHPAEPLLGQLRRRLPGVDVQRANLGAGPQRLRAVLGDSRAVVVPLSLSAHDAAMSRIREAAWGTQRAVLLTHPLGPHPLLAAAMIQRAQAAGARRGDPIVMVAPPASDSSELVDNLAQGKMLQAHWGAPVRVAHLGGRGRRVHELVVELKSQGAKNVFVAPYLLTSGKDYRQVVAMSTVAGSAGTGESLAGHPLVVELVVRRFAGAVRGASSPEVDKVA